MMEVGNGGKGGGTGPSSLLCEPHQSQVQAGGRPKRLEIAKRNALGLGRWGVSNGWNKAGWAQCPPWPWWEKQGIS